MTQEPPGRKFKICLISISLAEGGAERSCAMLSRMLADSGHQVHLAVLNNHIDFEYSGSLFKVGADKKQGENALQRYRRNKE